MLKSADIEEKKLNVIPGQGQTTHYWCQQEGLITMVISCKFKKNLFNLLISYTFTRFKKCTTTGQGQTTPGDKILMSTETSYHFSTSFKQISLKSDFIHFFMILYIYIAPGQGLTTPWGRSFYVNRNILSLWSFVASFKTISLILYKFFHDFIHVYSPGVGADNTRFNIVMSTKTSYHFGHLLQV